MTDIILASASPRRSELMTLAGFEFDVICADIDEIVPENALPQEVVMSLALQKAQAVAKDHGKSAVVGSDTVVALDGKILGKPHSEKEAVEMLRSLSGRTHKVYTGVAIVCGDKVTSFFDETEVEFYPLNDEEIFDYVATGEPMDKAGAYGIQGRGAVLVKRINGDYFNVMGLPISKVYRELKDYVK
ncbi:MAG: Maf family protein [Acutalibacteraceae bacterium]